MIDSISESFRVEGAASLTAALYAVAVGHLHSVLPEGGSPSLPLHI